MDAENVTRSQLVATWERKALELRQQAVDAGHIDTFLKRVESVPGATAGDIGFHWSLQQQGERPLWGILLLVVLSALTAVAFKAGGLLLAGLALISLVSLRAVTLYLHWKVEVAFVHELFARAEVTRQELANRVRVSRPSTNLLAA